MEPTLREWHGGSVDVCRMASEVAIDEVVLPSELRAELAARFDFYEDFEKERPEKKRHPALVDADRGQLVSAEVTIAGSAPQRSCHGFPTIRSLYSVMSNPVAVYRGSRHPIDRYFPYPLCDDRTSV